MRRYKESCRSILTEVRNSDSIGTYAFYRSDMLVSKTSKAYISVRFSSPRVIATETGNKENLKGYYLGDGVMALMRDGKEYENIFKQLATTSTKIHSTVPYNTI